MNSMNDDRVLGWDDEISHDMEPKAVIPEGVYPFEIVNLKRAQHQPKKDGTGKLPPCPKAEITVRVYPSEGQHIDLTETLFLHSRCEGILCQFFKAIGQRKHGEPLRPDWTRVIGSKGWCKVSVRNYTKTDGEQGQANDVKSFLDPEKAPKGGSVPDRPLPPSAAEEEF